MADTKLSALTELAATPASDDEVYIRDVSEAAADESKRITIANLLAGAAGKSIATGNYTGNGADNRQITTGFKCSLVILTWTLSSSRIVIPTALAIDIADGVSDITDVALHATDGFEVDNQWMNSNAVTYYYWAISE